MTRSINNILDASLAIKSLYNRGGKSIYLTQDCRIGVARKNSDSTTWFVVQIKGSDGNFTTVAAIDGSGNALISGTLSESASTTIADYGLDLKEM